MLILPVVEILEALIAPPAIVPLALILPVVDILDPRIAPACAIAALTPAHAPTAIPDDPLHDILPHIKAPF